MNNLLIVNSNSNFDVEMYNKSTSSLQLTETIKVTKLSKRSNNYPVLMLLAGSLGLSSQCDANTFKKNIRSERVLEFDNFASFLFDYDEKINSPLSKSFNELAEKIPQKKVAKKDLIKEIISFESLKLNWDGYGAYPLEVESAANAIELINFLAVDVYSQIDQIYPNPNGTISIVWSNKFNEEVSIEIGNKTMSYYVQICSKEILFYNNIFINEVEANKISKYVITMV